MIRISKAGLIVLIMEVFLFSGMSGAWADEQLGLYGGVKIADENGISRRLIGGTPGSCGYAWDSKRQGWHRPWDSESFIPGSDKPEWDRYIHDSLGRVVKVEDKYVKGAAKKRLSEELGISIDEIEIVSVKDNNTIEVGLP